MHTWMIVRCFVVGVGLLSILVFELEKRIL